IYYTLKLKQGIILPLKDWKNAKIDFVDLDDPGLSDRLLQKSLHYEDKIIPTGPFNEVLFDSTQAATA
ncbi:hypothetical protein GcC1_189023, partial [Golovinomyces cichoracearum]